EFTGTNFAEMRDWGWRSVHHPDHVADVEARYRAAISAGATWEDTFPLRGADGRYRWFLSRAQPLHGATGRVLCWFGTNTDITAQR
ncbi:PAS domain-containing protein, partial [Acinetobacter baumannii]